MWENIMGFSIGFSSDYDALSMTDIGLSSGIMITMNVWKSSMRQR